MRKIHKLLLPAIIFMMAIIQVKAQGTAVWRLLKLSTLLTCELRKKNYYLSRSIAVKKRTNKKFSALPKPLICWPTSRPASKAW